MKLTDDFYLHEFIKSELAVRKGIDNTPTPTVTANLTSLCKNILQPIRTRCNHPVTISSGYRSPALNKAIGGSVTSQHMTGEAADFEIVGMDNKELAKWVIKHLDFDQLILEFYKDGDPNSGWVHCSYNCNKNRHSVLTATKQFDGKTKYSEGLV